MPTPTIDILLATFNGAAYLQPQMESLLRQTYPAFRILVSDDGSSDETMSLIQAYVNRCPGRIIYVPNPCPGQGAIRNFEHLMETSLAHGQAKWMAFADQDDIWLPDKLTHSAVAMLSLEGEVEANTPCLVHTDLYVMNASAEPMHPSFVRSEGLKPESATATTLLSVNVVTGCTMLVNRALLVNALPIPAEAIMHDWWCALISGSGRRVFLPLPTVGYRQHSSNQIGARNRSFWSRLKRVSANFPAVLSRVRQLGVLTWGQAQALDHRLCERELAHSHVVEYLSWRQKPKWIRIANYRRYYLGPQLDCLSRWWFWQGSPA